MQYSLPTCILEECKLYRERLWNYSTVCAIKFYNLSLNRCYIYIIVFQSSEYIGQLIRTEHRTNMYLNDRDNFALLYKFHNLYIFIEFIYPTYKIDAKTYLYYSRMRMPLHSTNVISACCEPIESLSLESHRCHCEWYRQWITRMMRHKLLWDLWLVFAIVSWIVRTLLKLIIYYKLKDIHFYYC